MKTKKITVALIVINVLFAALIYIMITDKDPVVIKPKIPYKTQNK